MTVRTRILFVITGLSTGGAEMMLCQLIGRLDRAAFRPGVVVLTGRSELQARLEAQGVWLKNIGLGLGRPPGPAAVIRLIKAAREFNPHLIQGWMYHGNLAASLTARFLPNRPPVAWNIRQSLSDSKQDRSLTRAVIRLGAWLSPTVDLLINNSQASEAQHRRMGYAAAAGLVIPNGFDLEVFKPDPAARVSVRTELGLTQDKLLIGLIGRFHPMKDHAGFLEAAAMIQRERPEICFLLAGQRVDQYNPALSGRVEALGLAGRVHLLGRREDVPRLTAALDLAVSASSRAEGFSNVVGEAMACGVPCVVTDVGDSARLVDRAGLVVPPRSPAALAGACLALLAWPSEQRMALGLAGRSRISRHYSLDAVTRRYEVSYRRLLEEGKRPLVNRR
ncbi:MAG: glycosyltransferase [Thermodesulfobacteriota bacterium]